MYERLLDCVGNFRLCGRFQIVWEISDCVGDFWNGSPWDSLQRAPWDYAYKEPLEITLTEPLGIMLTKSPLGLRLQRAPGIPDFMCSWLLIPIPDF
jgi:hypothetical protein